MAVEITLSQLLELCAPESRAALLQAYQGDGFHFLVIQADSSGQWEAFGVGPREECRTLEQAESRSRKTTLATLYVVCPECPRAERPVAPDVFSFLVRWTRELVKKESEIDEVKVGGPFTRERIELDARQNRMQIQEKEMEGRIRDLEEREKSFGAKEAEVAKGLKGLEAEKEKRMAEVIKREKALQRQLEELSEREAQLAERENYVMQSEERLMTLTMEQQEREAQLEQMLDDIEKKKAVMGE